MSKKKNEWVVYPDVEVTIDDLKQYLNMQENENVKPEELQNVNLSTLPEVKEVSETTITEELDEVEAKISEEVEEKEELSEEELKEIYVQQLKDSKKVFKPLSHPTKVVGTETVVSSIGRERKVKEKTVQTNITTNQFGAKYNQKRKRKNKLTKASRRNNRK